MKGVISVGHLRIKLSNVYNHQQKRSSELSIPTSYQASKRKAKTHSQSNLPSLLVLLVLADLQDRRHDLLDDLTRLLRSRPRESSNEHDVGSGDLGTGARAGEGGDESLGEGREDLGNGGGDEGAWKRKARRSARGQEQE